MLRRSKQENCGACASDCYDELGYMSITPDGLVRFKPGRLLGNKKSNERVNKTACNQPPSHKGESHNPLAIR